MVKPYKKFVRLLSFRGSKAVELTIRRDRKVSQEVLLRLAEGRQKCHEATDLSDSARRKMIKACEWLQYVTPVKNQLSIFTKKRFNFHLAFVTLTLPASQKHSDKELTEICLSPFLENLKKNYRAKNYVWKAEKQKNGNIHYHVIIDSFIHYRTIQNLWNNLLDKLGYIDRFYFKNGNRNPHSTEIKAARSENDVKGYIAKYISKKDSTQGITGRKWGCTYELSRMKPVKLFSDNIVFDAILELMRQARCKYYEAKHCAIWELNIFNLNRLLHPELQLVLPDYFKPPQPQILQGYAC